MNIRCVPCWLAVAIALVASPLEAQGPDFPSIPSGTTLRGEFRQRGSDRPARLRGRVIRTNADTLWLRRSQRSTIAIPRGTVLQLQRQEHERNRAGQVVLWSLAGTAVGFLGGGCADGNLECVAAVPAGAAIGAIIGLATTRPKWVRFYPAPEGI